MKRLMTIGIIGLVAFTSIMIMKAKTPQTQALIYSTSTPRPTETIIPSATIGYQDTAIAAQQTAMEAVRVNAAITAEFEQRVQDQLMLTAEADRRYFEIAGWTQTAAPTSIALTSTAQLIVLGNQTLQASQMTATANAPTQIVAINNSLRNVQNSRRDDIIYLVGVSSVIFFVICFSVFLVFILPNIEYKKYEYKIAQLQQEEQPEELEPDMTPYIREDHGGGDFSQWFVPCTQEQLTELAEMVVNGERNLAINRIETTSRTLRRPTLIHLRKFLRANQFATELGNGEIALNDRAVAFIEQWFENHELESGYSFTLSPSA